MTKKVTMDALKQELCGDLGYQLDLESSFDQAQQLNGLGTSAHSFINTAVKCYIVGLQEPAAALIDKASDWLCYAVECNERPIRYFPCGTESQRYYH
jgi:hypothetical protein